MLLLQAVLAVLAWRRTLGNPTVPECEEPKDLDTTFTSEVHESFLMLTGPRHRHSSDIRFYRAIQRTYIHGERSCDLREHRTSLEPVSLCPWHYVVNVDMNRRPVQIVEARCNCLQCLNGLANSRCRPIKYYTRVLRKYACDIDTRVYRYRETIEPVTVGCSCEMI